MNINAQQALIFIFSLRFPPGISIATIIIIIIII